MVRRHVGRRLLVVEGVLIGFQLSYLGTFFHWQTSCGSPEESPNLSYSNARSLCSKWYTVQKRWYQKKQCITELVYLHVYHICRCVHITLGISNQQLSCAIVFLNTNQS